MSARRIAVLCLCLCLAGCAAENGQQLANTFDSGVAAYDAGDHAKAYAIWSAIADQDLAAQRNVAMMLRKGDGVAKDPAAAEDMYRRAAEAGLPTAQADLADMLLKGEAGPPNPKAALPLLVAAAAANHPVAQYELAQMYESGQDGLVPQNLETARRLYAEAAGHGMKEAADKVRQLGPPAAPPTPVVGR
ncbi:MAG: sel1 repeat family protein [Alphaproteobacteria bacterium]|nr:sel1 repeat family protein [Alphaproteobacteria bacterium]